MIRLMNLRRKIILFSNEIYVNKPSGRANNLLNVDSKIMYNLIYKNQIKFKLDEYENSFGLYIEKNCFKLTIILASFGFKKTQNK